MVAEISGGRPIVKSSVDNSRFSQETPSIFCCQPEFVSGDAVRNNQYADSCNITGLTQSTIYCTCTGTESLPIGPDVAVESGARVTFISVNIVVKSKLEAREGAYVKMGQCEKGAGSLPFGIDIVRSHRGGTPLTQGAIAIKQSIEYL
ncbi:MAG: hypothetical protein LJE96_01705 [Deltaproteobacteria bacterium]|nr:hypothetical protein [Deltaproteobacteria bacterium]